MLSTTLSSLVVSAWLAGESLEIQGAAYAMHSPAFELPLYLGLGLACGAISVCFTTLRDAFAALFEGTGWGARLPVSSLPRYARPVLGGLACGLFALVLPQTLFSSYSTLDQLIAGREQLPVALLLALLGSKLLLTSFALSSGLVGGVFAPSLFVSSFDRFLTACAYVLR